MRAVTWFNGFVFTHAEWVGGEVHVQFASHTGRQYRIEYADQPESGESLAWSSFVANGTLTATSDSRVFVDDFTPATSGGESPHRRRFYRVTY